MNLPRPFLIICLTLALTMIVSWSLYYRQVKEEDSVDITKFPKTIGTWSSVDMHITKDEFAILETNNAFARKYTNAIDKSVVYLYIVYSQDNRKVAHPPEVCYTGSGISVQERPRVKIKVNYKNMLITSNCLRLNKGDFNQVVYYWFKVGDRFTPSYWKQQILIAFNTLLGKKTSSALVRISTDITTGNTEKASQRIKTFTDLITRELFTYLP